MFIMGGTGHVGSATAEVDGGFAMPDDATRGETTLDAYIRGLVARS